MTPLLSTPITWSRELSGRFDYKMAIVGDNHSVSYYAGTGAVTKM
jgi:hypothetical protein